LSITIREYKENDIISMQHIWNEVVNEGIAFPETNHLTIEESKMFFANQNFAAVAEKDNEIVGLYILLPNNVGRCGHIANASYAIKSSARGLHIGEQLIKHSLEIGHELGFRILQFNSVVSTNYCAIHLYEKLGFIKLGVIPGGFLTKNGSYEDIISFYRTL
jgi:L-amino acid N-acyltransferase YncA